MRGQVAMETGWLVHQVVVAVGKRWALGLGAYGCVAREVRFQDHGFGKGGGSPHPP